MTKKEVVRLFNTEILPAVRARYEQDGIPDWPARREEWNNYVDSLIKDGQVPRSADGWSGPTTVVPRSKGKREAS